MGQIIGPDPGINDRVEDLENAKLRITYFEVIDINASTAGSIVIPATGSLLVSEELIGNAVLSTLNANSYPDGNSPVQGVTVVTANLDALGNWTTNSIYTGGLVALIYRLSIARKDEGNLTEAQVIDRIELDGVGSGGGGDIDFADLWAATKLIKDC